jgi:hypothetical protein
MKLDQISAAVTGTYGAVSCNYDDDYNLYKVARYAFDLSGTFTGSVVAEVSHDGTNFVTVGITSRLTDSIAASVTSAGAYVFSTEGAVKARLSVTRSTGTLVLRPTTILA